MVVPQQHKAKRWASQLFKYYDSLESRIGYRLFLGGTRHFGYYDAPTRWPFPVALALRRMEDKLLKALSLPSHAKVLDCGCGVGHVAIHMAQKGGLNVEAFDFMPRHVRKAKENIKAAGLEDRITARQMDYHHLDGLGDDTYDGLYTMETLVHSTDPRAVVAEFYRVLKPGGVMVLQEYDHQDKRTAPPQLADSFDEILQIGSMPAWEMFLPGVLEEIIRDAGFVEVTVVNMSNNIVPMLWLFYVFAYIPYIIVKLLHLEPWFVNTLAGVSCYRGRQYWSYLQYRARKPMNDHA